MINSKNIYCFTGASGVGKTTLLNEIKKWPTFDVIELSARPYLPKNNKDYVKNSSEKIQALINYGSMVSMMDGVLNSKHTNLFFSRCSIDRLAYAMTLDIAKDLSSITIDDIVLNLKNVKVFYLPIEFDLPNDDTIRGTNEEIRCKTDEAIVSIMEQLNVNYIEVSGTVEERLQIIKNNL